MNPGTIVRISKDDEVALFQVHLCQKNSCLIFPVGYPDQLSRLILVNNIWYVEGSEDIPYQIQILFSGLTNPFILTQILLNLEVNDIRNLCLVSPDFKQVCEKRDFWEEYYRHKSIHQSPAKYPSPIEFYIRDFLAKKAESEKWTNSNKLLRDLGMPNLDLEQYLNQNVYPLWLEQVRRKNESNPIKAYSVFESYEQGAGHYQGRSKLEAGLQYLMETGFGGLYDEFSSLFEDNPEMTLGEVLRRIEKDIKESTRKIDLDDEE